MAKVMIPRLPVRLLAHTFTMKLSSCSDRDAFSPLLPLHSHDHCAFVSSILLLPMFPKLSVVSVALVHVKSWFDGSTYDHEAAS